MGTTDAEFRLRLRNGLRRRATLSTAAVDDDTFANRHNRQPKPHDTNEYNRPCQKNDASTYGRSSDNSLNISFTYDLTVKSILYDVIEPNVLPPLENSIVKRLVQFYDVKQCDDRRLDALLGESDASFPLLGISVNPPDTLGNENCNSTDSFGNESKCARVNGGISFYADDNTSVDAMESVGNEVIQFLIENMEKGTFNDSYEGILRIEFVRLNLFQFYKNGEILRLNPLIGREKQLPSSNVDDQQSPQFTAIVVITGSVFFFLVISIEKILRRFRKPPLNNVEKNVE